MNCRRGITPEKIFPSLKFNENISKIASLRKRGSESITCMQLNNTPRGNIKDQCFLPALSGRSMLHDRHRRGREEVASLLALKLPIFRMNPSSLYSSPSYGRSSVPVYGVITSAFSSRRRIEKTANERM